MLCVALWLAICVCAVTAMAAWRWIPRQYPQLVRLEAVRGDGVAGNAGSHILLRNVFSLYGGNTKPTFPKIVSGAWGEETAGLRWRTQSEIEGQTDAIEVALPAAEGYTFFFLGDRQSGRVRITFLDTGESELFDTYRDSGEPEQAIIDSVKDGSANLDRMHRSLALAILGCVAASGLLFAVLYCLMRRNRAPLARAWKAWRTLMRRWEKVLLASRLAAPLNADKWGRYLLGLSLFFAIPLMAMAFYARPAMDDYIYGMSVKAIWQQIGSLAAVLQEGVSTAKRIFDSWSGTYAAMLLTALQPGIFGDRLYALGPLLIMISLIVSTCFFARAAVGKREGMVIAGLMIFLSVQFLPAVHESFYWFAGGIGYTFFYSLSLVLYGLVLRAHRADTRAKRIACLCAACLFAIVVGAGNFVTALLSCVLLGLLAAYRVIRKSRRWWIPSAALIASACALIVCASAPGNAMRQAASIRTSMPYAQAVLLSFPHAFHYLMLFFRVEYLLGLLIALPFLYRAAERSGCSFRYPLAASLLSFCVYACQFTPHLAAYGIDGPDRMMDIIYFVTFWLVGGNCFYWLGWLAKKRKAAEAVRVFARWTAVTAAGLLAISCAAAIANPEAMNGSSAASSLISGQAARYGEALAERAALCEDPTNTGIVEVSPLPPKPRVLQEVELLPDPYWEWLNGEIARYYGKEGIVVLWPNESD